VQGFVEFAVAGEELDVGLGELEDALELVAGVVDRVQLVCEVQDGFF
jgi:hypothetical protein